ncbi:DUF3426 domain-containing protein [Desulfobacter latus]|uniref:Zinc-ribbon domain-containing protein n=1 Tax=Desulfobacter latus TaxID=2292 RepID=A0A850T164_9BACT|nr:DUF3426 domain-containing protein [Desulfobacter latus]NWH06080.1 zinc-ribbon domain-containing protein [Desulfobacter latus]
MIITCEACATRFVLDDAMIKPEGSKVKCSKCRHIFTAFPSDQPKNEVPEEPKSEAYDITFDEQAFQDDSEFNESDDDDFSIDSDLDSQADDLEDTDIDFSDIEFDEPEFERKPPEHHATTGTPDIQDQEIEDPATDFEEDGLNFELADFEIDEPEFDLQDEDLKLDTQEFEFEEIENGSVSGLAPASEDLDPDTADIEISSSQDDDLDADLELEELSLDIDDLSVEESSIDDLELDREKDESPELEIDDDIQIDLTLEDDDPEDLSLEPEEARIDDLEQLQGDIIEAQPDVNHGNDFASNDIELEFDDNEEIIEEQEEREEEIASEQDKFAEYDKVLEQETEPEDAGITIPDPEIKDKTDTDTEDAPDISLPSTDDEIDTTTEASIDQAPLIPPPSEQSVHQKQSARNKNGGRLAVKILLVLFMLILAAYVAIIRLDVTIPVVSDIEIPFITQWLEPKQPAPQTPLKPVIDEPSIDGRFVSNKNAGDLFIVTGRIKNSSNAPVSYIQVKGTLMTKNNTKAATLIAYCGNIIPEETLKTGNISDITKQMAVKQGHQNTNVNIKPGASVMFMLVFSNLPEDLSNFTVAIEGFEPAQE